MVASKCQAVRELVMNFMNALPGQGAAVDGEDVVIRADGVREFGRQWVVRQGSEGESLSASFSDREDVIEFGLLQRDGEAVTHVLYATLVLDEDEILLNVVSEANMDFNFDTRLDESRLSRLQDTLRFYAAHVADGQGSSAP